MACFSVNQNRQLYVVDKVAAKAVSNENAVGSCSAHKTMENEIFFRYVGKGGLIRTDLVPKNHIISATSSAPKNYHTKGFKIQLKDDVNGGEPISGQDYLLRIAIHNFVGFSDEDEYIKWGVVHAHSNMDASDFYVEMVYSLLRDLSHEVIPMFKIHLTSGETYTEVNLNTNKSTLTGDYDGIAIYEVEQPWELGTRQVTHVKFDVYGDRVLFDGCERNWAIVLKDSGASEELPNGKEMADLEYFCMGERGDQYRQVGWPYTMKTEYLVDPSKSYYSVDIHYAFVDEGVSVQKSEKTMTFLTTTKSVADAILAEFKKD
jgi:hypothetical protein